MREKKAKVHRFQFLHSVKSWQNRFARNQREPRPKTKRRKQKFIIYHLKRKQKKRTPKDLHHWIYTKAETKMNQISICLESILLLVSKIVNQCRVSIATENYYTQKFAIFTFKISFCFESNELLVELTTCIHRMSVNYILIEYST